MSFLNPILFAVGAAAVAIPIIIHLLLRQRRKPVPWAAMRFLLEAYRKHRRKLVVQQWLLLALRCLAIALLAVAIGRPILAGAGNAASAGDRSLYIAIDNSLAATLTLPDTHPTHPGRTALDMHIDRARDAIDALAPADRVGIVTLGAPAEALITPATIDTRAAAALLNEIEPTHARADITGAAELIRDAINQERDTDGRTRDTRLLLLTESRLGSIDPSNTPPATLAAVPSLRLITTTPADTPVPNVQLTALDPLRSVVLGTDGNDRVTATVRRTGAATTTTATTTVRLSPSDPSDPSPNNTLAAGSTATINWQPGRAERSISIDAPPTPDSPAADDTRAPTRALTATIDRDAITADNTFRRLVVRRDALEVLILGGRRFTAGSSVAELDATDWFRLALAPTRGTPINTTPIPAASADPAALAHADAVLLPRPHLVPEAAWADLANFARRGGLLIITPPAETTVHLWTDPFLDAAALPWTIDREATDLTTNNDQTTQSDGLAIDPESISTSPTGLLNLLAAEFAELARPVRIQRLLRVDTEATDTTSAARVLLRLADGTPLLIAAPPGATDQDAAPTADAARGLVVYLAAAPEVTWTNLPLMPLMVALTQELVRQGVGRAASNAAITAGTIPALPPTAERLRGPEGRTAQPGEPLRTAGLWTALDPAATPIATIAVNADTNAGRTDTQSTETVAAHLQQLLTTDANTASAPVIANADELDRAITSSSTTSIATPTGERPDASPFDRLAVTLLLVALAIAIAETILARRFSNAVRPSTASIPEAAA